MFHPIFSVLFRRPELVMDHVAGYAALVKEEATSVGTEVAKRSAAGAAAAVCALLFLIFAGVAIMLGGVVGEFHWTLIVVPAVFLVLAGVGAAMAMKPLPNKAFGELRSQLGADAEALRMLKGQ
jgi:ABC-type polysaccharide/polyol phosphate export permease